MFCIKCNEELLPFFPSFKNRDHDNLTNISSLNSIKACFKGLNELNNNQINDSHDNLPPINCKYEDITSFMHTNNKK